MFVLVRNIVISIILIGLAYYFFVNQDELFSAENTVTKGAVIIEKVDIDKTTGAKDTAMKVEAQKTKEKPKRKNSAAEGLSNFYASINDFDEDDDGPRIIKNIVYLPEPKGSRNDLIKRLEAKRMITRPLRKNWNGTTTSRRFSIGETLYQKLSEYAHEDGLEVIWWLNRDLVVKDPFRINHNIVKTAHLIGKAVEGHFINGLSSYFCYQQRTIVMIDEGFDYLNEECILLSSEYK